MKREFGIAFMADDSKREDLVEVLKEFQSVLKECQLYATYVTGKVCSERLGLCVKLLESSVKGGDMQMGALVTEGKLDAVLYLRDPLIAPPYAPDVRNLLRVCDIHNVPFATNRASAWTTLYGIAMCRQSTGGANGVLKSLRMSYEKLS